MAGVGRTLQRLIFTCCHPALAPDAQVALTLREVCGLTTEEIARAFLTPAPTLAHDLLVGFALALLIVALMLFVSFDATFI